MALILAVSSHAIDPMKVRTRFAPSPTGYLHIGGVRIEDNILVTAGAPVNLTVDIPKGFV